MDTASDYRVRVAEAIVSELDAVFRGNRLRGQWNKGAFEAALTLAKTEALTLKYCYLEQPELVTSEASRKLVQAAAKMEAALGGPHWQAKVKEDRMAVAFARFAIANLSGFPVRFRLPGNNPENGVDLLAGDVLSAHKHPGADNLQITNVDAGHAFTVVTNDMTLKAGSRVAVAHLPPTELRGTLSEAMFCGIGGRIVTGVNAKKGERPVLPENAYAQVRNVITAWLKA